MKYKQIQLRTTKNTLSLSDDVPFPLKLSFFSFSFWKARKEKREKRRRRCSHRDFVPAAVSASVVELCWQLCVVSFSFFFLFFNSEKTGKQGRNPLFKRKNSSKELFSDRSSIRNRNKEKKEKSVREGRGKKERKREKREKKEGKAKEGKAKERKKPRTF